MNIDERIKKIDEYVVQFNAVVKESAYYLLLQFPEKWTVPGVQMLKETYKVECISGNTPGSIMMGVDMKDGYDSIFDAAEYIISFNKDIEERVALLNKYINDLKTIFSTRKLEELRSLRFSFDGNDGNIAELVAANNVVPPQTVETDGKENVTKKRGGKKKAEKVKEEAPATTEDDSLLNFVESTLE